MKRPVIIGLLAVALLLILTAIGAVIFFSIRDGGGFIPRTDLPSATAEESKSFNFDSEKPVELKIINDWGDVSITSGEVKEIQVNVVKTSYANTEGKAIEELKVIKYSIEQDGNHFSLIYDIPENLNVKVYNSVDFIIIVPPKTIATVNGNFGDVTVRGIEGNTDVTLSFGDIQMENISGAVTVTSSGGDITLTSIKAGSSDIGLHSDFGDIILEKVSGKNINISSDGGKIKLLDARASGSVSTHNDFGDTYYESGSAKTLTIETNGGAVDLLKLKVSGEIVVQNDFGDIDLEQASAGSYDLNTNGGNITVNGAKGSLKAHTDFGDIQIGGAENVTLDLKSSSGTIDFTGSLGKGPHVLKSDFGEIALTLPADTKIDVDLKTDFGDIESDLPITSVSAGSAAAEESHIVGSINGGGSSLTAVTNSGRISIKTLDK